MKFKDAAFMGIMRWAFYGELKKRYPDVSLTYGYITKNTRIENGLPKEHYVDARCISGHPLAKPLGTVFYIKKVRCHNRQIHKFNLLKKGVRKRNQAEYEVYGFRLYDKVSWKGRTCFVFSRKSTGYITLRLLDGTRVKASASYKKIKLLRMRSGYLIELRSAIG